MERDHRWRYLVEVPMNINDVGFGLGIEDRPGKVLRLKGWLRGVCVWLLEMDRRWSSDGGGILR